MLSKNENKLDVIREAFSDHDIDDSGYLDKSEFMACLGTLGVQEQFGRDFKAHVNHCFQEYVRVSLFLSLSLSLSLSLACFLAFLHIIIVTQFTSPSILKYDDQV